jgi:hypothetical protein
LLILTSSTIARLVITNLKHVRVLFQEHNNAL